MAKKTCPKCGAEMPEGVCQLPARIRLLQTTSQRALEAGGKTARIRCRSSSQQTGSKYKFVVLAERFAGGGNFFCHDG